MRRARGLVVGREDEAVVAVVVVVGCLLPLPLLGVGNYRGGGGGGGGGLGGGLDAPAGVERGVLSLAAAGGGVWELDVRAADRALCWCVVNGRGRGWVGGSGPAAGCLHTHINASPTIPRMRAYRPIAARPPGGRHRLALARLLDGAEQRLVRDALRLLAPLWL